MSSDDNERTTSLELRRPAVFLRAWSDRHDELDRLVEGLLPARRRLGPGHCAFLALPGDPAAVEAAAATARTLLAEESLSARCLIYPGEVIEHGEELRPVRDALGQELEEEPPTLEPKRLHLTGHALGELESRWNVEPRGFHERPSGRRLSLFALGRPRLDRAPWRNPEVLGRVTPFVERESLSTLAAELDRNLLSVEGPLGSGKTRAVVEAVQRAGRQLVVATAWTERSLGPTILQQLALGLIVLRETSGTLAMDRLREHRRWFEPTVLWRRREGEQLLPLIVAALAETRQVEPLHVVLDDLHVLEPEERSTLDALLDVVDGTAGLHLIQVSRPGADLPDADRTVRVPPLRPSERETLWSQLTDYLSMPSRLQTRLGETCSALPFAAEELLIRLLRRRALRELYGSYFYSGAPEVSTEASSRLIRHVEAEALRCDCTDALRVLSVSGAGVNEDHPALHRHGGRSDWRETAIECGLASARDGQLRIPLEILEQAVRWTLTAPSQKALGLELGETHETSNGSWQHYKAVAGQEEAVPLLLELLKTPPQEVEARQLFEATQAELEAHRNRSGDLATELELLWGMLRLARVVGALQNLESALDRALELAQGEPHRELTLFTLKAEHEQKAGRLEAAERYLKRALRHAQGSDLKRQTVLLIQLGRLLQDQERHAEAGALLQQVIERLEGTEHVALAATCRFQLANVFLSQYRTRNALEMHWSALEARRERGLTAQVAVSLSAIGSCHLARGDYGAALETFRESLSILERLKTPADLGLSYTLLGLARVMLRLGDPEEAIRLVRQGLALRQELDDRLGESIARLDLAEAQLLRDQPSQALQEARRAHFSLTLLELPRHLANAEQLLGRILIGLQEPTAAAQHLETAFAIHDRIQQKLAASFDRSWLLEVGLATRDASLLASTASQVAPLMRSVEHIDRGEQIDLRLYRTFSFLRDQGHDSQDPLPYLERAHGRLMRRTGNLPAELRHGFLLRVAENRQILDAASQHGLGDSG